MKLFKKIGIISCFNLLAPSFFTSCSNVGDTTLVVYFSCTGNTKDVANKIVNNLNCFSFQIQPKVPYNPETDFGPEGRANKEQAGELPNPEISNSITNFNKYSKFFIGYPIWAGQLPKIIFTLCNLYNCENKTIRPVCTSTETEMGPSIVELKMLEPKANFLDGKTFLDSSLPSQDQVNNWIKTLNL